jgi:CMP-N,N'-diacetyllegionaminic acid synthase
MLADRRVLAVVPARGGSTGIKLKNLRTVGGVSLVALAARVALASPLVDRAILSTDHPDIAEAGRAAGLAVPFVRPDGLQYDIVVMLQPTSPGRRVEHVEAAIEKLVDGGHDAVWTVSETDSKAHPLKQLTVDREGRLDYYDPAGARIIARQQLTPVYHRNGIAYAITRQCLLDQKSIKGASTGAVIIDEPLVNIDTEFDLMLANVLASGLRKV